MAKGKRRSLFAWLFLLLLAVGCLSAYLWAKGELKPMPADKSLYVRFDQQTKLDTVLDELKTRNVVKNPAVLHWYAVWKREAYPVKDGTYQLNPGMTVDQVLKAIRKPIVQMVRIPETNFSYRTANLLAKKGVFSDPKQYKQWIKDPQAFKGKVDFPLPTSSLEGYLYPDTYDLPPIFGARNVIIRQLDAFGKKVWPLLKDVKDPNRVLTIASMVELEAAKDKDRPLIAGVIENRIARNMRLQIDATVLYALQQWRRLTFADYKNTISAYNTYLADGLPPGPICSPSLKSVEAALKPAHHNYLYYVALPTGYHLFAATYPEHEANIAKRKAAMAMQRKAAARQAASSTGAPPTTK